MIKYLSKIIQLNKLQVVGLVRKENEEIYNVLTVHKNGNKINILSAVTFYSYEDFTKNTDAKLPVLLLIDGKGVLNKKIDFNNSDDVNWSKTIDLKTIYHTSFKSDNYNFMSFCRENAAQEILSKLKQNNFHVIDIYVGSFLSALLNNYIKKEIIFSGDLALKFENEKLTNFIRKTELQKTENYTIGEDVISSEFLPLYGAIIHFFIQQKEVVKSENKSVEVDEILYKKAFSVLGMVMLGGFLVLLMTSYFLIQYYGTKNAELTLQSVYSSQSYKQLQELENQKEKQLGILKESSLMSSKFLSFYGYELMKETPSVIALTALNIIPIDKEVKPEKKINFEIKSIILKGESTNESAINNWMEKLKEMKWIKRFEIISLKKDKKNISQFEIKITVADV
jgi:hypothetical protein